MFWHMHVEVHFCTTDYSLVCGSCVILDVETKQWLYITLYFKYAQLHIFYINATHKMFTQILKLEN